ncbi:MAG: glutamine amidotransferase [Thermoplasmatales archaeon SG8-52-3]|nr:MAG: glutamine amidotransferase [Thermoplasmatales archaeon SG8-52-3]
MLIGIVGVQGAISEHINSMKNALYKLNIKGDIIVIKDSFQIDEIDALIIPGGESTTISNILQKSGLYNEIFKKIKEKNLPIMGTCAGCVLLASELVEDIKEIKLLYAMNMKVKRNAYGGQRESFECDIDIKGFKKQYNAIFIRAPIIQKVWGDCEIIAKFEDDIIMARQGKFLALSFHPELTDDIRIQKYFIDMI